MPSPNQDPQAPNTYFSPSLRDKVLEHLPPNVKEKRCRVTVTYRSKTDAGLSLTMHYLSEPGIDDLVEVEVAEEIDIQPPGRYSGMLLRGFDIDPETAEVSAHLNSILPSDSSKTAPMNMQVIQLEQEATTFGADDERYFLDFFDGL